LTAYSIGLGYPRAKLLNICFTTDFSGNHQIKDWTDSAPRLWNHFRLVLKIWQSKLGRGFNPTQLFEGCIEPPDWEKAIKQSKKKDFTRRGTS